LLSSGAAAGVAAGFNAPIAGVFFALEIMQNAFESIDQKKKTDIRDGMMSSSMSFTTNTNITPILIASVLSALIAQSILGNHLIFKAAKGVFIQTPLTELPLFFLLGAMSGVVSFIFSYTAKVSKSFFAGKWGVEPVRNVVSSLPEPIKPAIGGLLCGLVGWTTLSSNLVFRIRDTQSLTKERSIFAHYLGTNTTGCEDDDDRRVCRIGIGRWDVCTLVASWLHDGSGISK
jgi:H+/Cl- antiporter ClcA